MTETLSIRASSLPGWADCSRRWAAQNLAATLSDMGFDLPTLPASIGAAVGTGTHAGAAYLLECKRDTTTASPTEAEDRAVAALRDAMDGGALYDDTTKTLSDAQKQTARLVKSYATHLLPVKRPVEVEKYRSATADGATLTGHCDLQEDDGISDTKTGVALSAYHAQAGAYALLARADGGTVNTLSIDYLKRVRLSRDQPPPQILFYDVAAAERLAWRTMDAISRTVEQFNASGDEDEFIPNPASPLCGPKYCRAHNTAFCAYGKDKPE